MSRIYERLLSRLRRRIANMINRAIITRVDNSGGLTRLQLKTKAGQLHDGVEYFEVYGFTSTPLVGAEVLLLCLGGFRIAICANDRRYRVTGTAAGDVVVHDHRGQKITLTDAGVAVETALALTVSAASASFDCDISTTGSISAGADVSDATGSMQGMRDVFNPHVHPENNAPGGSTSATTTPMV